MYCMKCGAQLPDDAVFCSRCGANQSNQTRIAQQSGSLSNSVQVLAPSTATSVECPSCGAPIAPKFGEMIITCEYCGSSVTLGSSGWANIQKQTMLPLRIQGTDDISARVRSMMDTGLLHRHLQESSTLEEMNLSVVPYWLVATSASTALIATDMVAEGATVATTAALFGVMAGMGGRRGRVGGPKRRSEILGTMLGGRTDGGGKQRSIHR